MSREGFEPIPWASKGIPRSEAERWWDSGFDLGEALRWRERFGVEEAVSWRTAGVTNLAEARSWGVAGVEAGDVAGWRDAGIGFAEAAAWHEFGYSLEEARQRKAEGKTPSETFLGRVRKMRTQRGQGHSTQMGSGQIVLGGSGAAGPPATMQRFLERMRGVNHRLIHGYFMRQWVDDEALSWAENGIDAADALAWKEFGISAAEAGRLTKAGHTPAGTMRAWWQAGIPVDEVAAWLGAGLTPEEAAAQRLNGVTAERAAVLRALRENDDQSAADWRL
jgi:hypothetical protein